MNFGPILLSIFVGSVLVGCGKETPKVVPAGKIIEEEVTEKPRDFVVYDPRVDILFVVDNSGSMADAQEEVVRSTRLFATEIARATLLDFHIGVISTDPCTFGPSCGRLVGRPNFVEKSTPDLVRKLARRLRLGTSGSGTEQMFAPVKTALSAPLETGVNKGFYRDGAFLAIIFITDAADQSGINEKDLLNFLLAKKIDPEKVLAYGAIRKLQEANTCLPNVEPLDGKLESFLASVTNGGAAQGNIVSLCERNFGRRLATFAKDIVQRTASSIRLKQIPDVKTIRVFYGSQEIPNEYGTGWTFESKTNSIVLGNDVPWDTTQKNPQLRIDFTGIEP